MQRLVRRLNQVVAAAARRARRVGIRVIVDKLRVRAWSTRIAIIVASGTEPRPPLRDDPPLDFSVLASGAVDEREVASEALRGADLLYAEALIRMYRHRPGVAMQARDVGGGLVGMGLMLTADPHERPDAVPPGSYPGSSPDECWTEAHFVVPTRRGLRVLGRLLDAERDYLRERGFRSAFASIDSANVASLRAFARAGYEPTGVVRVDRYRLNRYTGRLAALDGRTQGRWVRSARRTT